MNIKRKSFLDNMPAQVLKIGKLINYLPILGISGVIKFVGLEKIEEVPFIDGIIHGKIPTNYSTVSVDTYHRRFISNFYNIHLEKRIEYLYKEIIWDEIDSFLLDLREMFLFLKEIEFTGFIKIRNIVTHSVSFVFLENGMLVAAEKDGYRGRAILIDIVEEIHNNHCKIGVYKVDHENLSLYFSLYRHVYTTTDYNQVLDIIKNLDMSVIQVIQKDDVNLVFDIFIDNYEPPKEDIVFYEIYNIYRLANNIPKMEYKDIKDASSILRKLDRHKPARIRLSCPVCCSTVSMFDTVCPVCGTLLIQSNI